MNKLNLLPNLTKKYILERITQEEIMAYYTGIPVNNDTLTGNSFLSPIRVDINPTANYYYKDDNRGETRLRLKDWNGTFNGDVFDVASHFTKINAKSSQGFVLLLHKIAKDFKIHKYADQIERDKLEITLVEYFKTNELRVFKVIPRAWNVYDKRFWYDNIDVDSNLLRLGKVIAVQELEVEGKDGYLHNVYKYTMRDTAYAYYGGEINGIKIWKIYFPFRKDRRRFLTNYSFIQGNHIFQPSRIGLITKSYKDVLCMKTFGIQAKGVPSETYLMTPDEIFDIKSKCDFVFTNFDYDKAGILLANKYKRVYGILPLMFTRGRFNQPDYGVKDFTEYRERYGRAMTVNLIQSVLDRFEPDIKAMDKYNKEAIGWIQ